MLLSIPWYFIRKSEAKHIWVCRMLVVPWFNLWHRFVQFFDCCQVDLFHPLNALHMCNSHVLKFFCAFFQQLRLQLLSIRVSTTVQLYQELTPGRTSVVGCSSLFPPSFLAVGTLVFAAQWEKLWTPPVPWMSSTMQTRRLNYQISNLLGKLWDTTPRQLIFQCLLLL